MGAGKGIVPPTPPGLTLASPQGESRHATTASTRATIDGAGGTRATTPVTQSKWQPQDLAIVNRPDLISSLLTRSAGQGRTPGWWATTRTIHSSQRNSPPGPLLSHSDAEQDLPYALSKYYGGAQLRQRGAGFIYSHSPDGYGNGWTPTGTI